MECSSKVITYHSVYTLRTSALSSEYLLLQLLNIFFCIFLKKYLQSYHYIASTRSGNHDFTTAVRHFQHFMNLPVTGDVDRATTLWCPRRRRWNLQYAQKAVQRVRLQMVQNTPDILSATWWRSAARNTRAGDRTRPTVLEWGLSADIFAHWRCEPSRLENEVNLTDILILFLRCIISHSK